MADQIQYKCPNCSASIEFSSAAQKMRCPYCDSEFDVQALAALDAGLDSQDDMQWQTAAGGEWGSDEEGALQEFACRSCGGVLITDANTSATICPYCDSPVALKGRLSGSLRPDAIIPFKYGKQEAKDALKKHMSGKRLLPKVFKDQNHIDEIKGVYVPFWLFDADVQASVRYDATNIHTWSDSNYRYTRTDHYIVDRGGGVAFDLVPVDGSSQMDDDLMESVEPFDFRGGAKEFQTAYLAGYLADKYDVTAEQSIERADQRIKRSTEDAFRATVSGYDTVTARQSAVQIKNGRARYALYPVWILNTSWNGRRFTFAMNGQTGKMVGDLPLDSTAAALWLFGISAVSFAIIFGLLWFLGLDVGGALIDVFAD